MDDKILKISMKGAFLIMLGVGLINLALVNLLSRIGFNEDIIIILLNTILSSGVVAYVLTYVDQKKKDKKLFLSRYIKFAILFGVTSFLWTKDIFI